MSKIDIFFGTDTGSTRLVAKKIYSLLGAEFVLYLDDVDLRGKLVSAA